MSGGSVLLFAELDSSKARRRRRLRVRDATLRRERLLRRLAQTTHGPLALLIAPAGYEAEDAGQGEGRAAGREEAPA